MANVLDYLDWRGDVLFSADPFNEVDNVILSQIAYARLDDLIGLDEELSAEEAVERLFRRFSREEIIANHSIHKSAPILLEKIASSQRFQGLKLAHYCNVIDPGGDAQIAAVTIHLPDFTYVAYRGTDETLAGWKEDFELSYSFQTKGQKAAVIYLNRVAPEAKGRLYVGGHSKGGNFALYAASFCNPRIRKKIHTVFSNDGPGFRKEITECVGYRNVLGRVKSIIPESTLVSTLFHSDYGSRIVKSNVNGLAQHDVTTWQVLRNHFVEAEDRSVQSYQMDEAVNRWISELSDEDRRFFTDVTFELLESTGATTLNELAEQGITGALDVLKNARRLPKDKRKEFNGMIKLLFLAGREARMDIGASG